VVEWWRHKSSAGSPGSGFAQRDGRRAVFGGALAPRGSSNRRFATTVAEITGQCSSQRDLRRAGTEPDREYIGEQSAGGRAGPGHAPLPRGHDHRARRQGRPPARRRGPRRDPRVTAFKLEDVQRSHAQVKDALAGALVAREQLALAEDNLRASNETARMQRLRVDGVTVRVEPAHAIQVQSSPSRGRQDGDARQPSNGDRKTCGPPTGRRHRGRFLRDAGRSSSRRTVIHRHPDRAFRV